MGIMKLNTAKGLETLMDERKMSVPDMADSYGCSRTHIYRLLDTGAKHIDTIEKLSSVLKIKPNEFIEASQPQ
jgi:DNA-binding Xre family transcriptional regulator